MQQCLTRRAWVPRRSGRTRRVHDDGDTGEDDGEERDGAARPVQAFVQVITASIQAGKEVGADDFRGRQCLLELQ